MDALISVGANLLARIDAVCQVNSLANKFAPTEGRSLFSSN